MPGGALLLAMVLCLAVGCGGGQAPAGRVAARQVAAIGAVTPVPASPGAPTIVALAESVSTVRYASLEALRDTVERLLRGAVNLADTAVHVSRDTVTFTYWYAKAPARGWAVRAVVNDASGCPVEALESALMARGWVMHNSYSADGPDGTALGLLSRDYFCLIEGSWEGEDATDTTYVPPPGCKVTATCVPLRRDDRLR